MAKAPPGFPSSAALVSNAYVTPSSVLNVSKTSSFAKPVVAGNPSAFSSEIVE